MDLHEINEKYSTIRYRHGASFLQQEAETSDILIHEWIASPPKQEDKKIEPCQFKTFGSSILINTENRFEERYSFPTNFIFNTLKGYVAEIQDGIFVKKGMQQKDRKGIRLYGKRNRRWEVELGN